MKKNDLEKVHQAVWKTEKEFGNGKGSRKRRHALTLLNALIDIPGVPEWLEAIILGYLIDLVIYLYNRWWSHAWVKNAPLAPDTRYTGTASLDRNT